MTAFLEELRRIAADLDESGVRWCLVGGLGASVYAEPRTTKDIDIVVAISTEDEFADLRAFLLNRGYTNPQLLLHTMPTRRMGWRLYLTGSRQQRVPVDLLSQACGIEQEIVTQAHVVELLPGVLFRVASLAHIIAMKLLSQNDTDRIQDRADLVGLVSVASPEDIEAAQQSVTLITERGFNSGKELVEELKMFLSWRSLYVCIAKASDSSD